MPQYKMLSEKNRKLRRTIADAIAVLRDNVDFTEHDKAEIVIGSLKLPSTDVVGLVQVRFESVSTDKIYVVSLPTSKWFKARHSNSSLTDRFDIDELAGALVNGIGEVRLAGGATLRAVEVVPTNLPLAPTELDWRIVGYTIAFVGEQERCYRRLSDDIPAQFANMFPDVRLIDCSKLSGLNIPTLESIAAYIGDKDTALRRLSKQKIANTLRTFGMRIPKRAPRSAPH